MLNFMMPLLTHKKFSFPLSFKKRLQLYGSRFGEDIQLTYCHMRALKVEEIAQ